jgi:methylamine dehydrogenase heavy chain
MNPSLPALVRRRTASALLVLCGAIASVAVHAELPVEQNRIEPLLPANDLRLYLTDPVMGHLVDGRVHIIDGGKMRYLGLIGTGFSASTVLSPDRQHLYVATTYHSRLQRGTRTDVVEIYRTDDLTFEREIEIPAKHAQGLQIKALMQPSADGRFLLIQNATPATSVTVVDLAAGKVTAEIPNPGCWGTLPWPQKATRFSSVCGDGTLQTFDVDAQGQAAGSQRSNRFFDPDTDPVFMHYEMVDNRATLVSYYGTVHRINLSGEQPSFAPTWSLLDGATKKQGWRPGGFALFAVDKRTDRLYIGMHAKGAEGTHKTPAEQIWTVDLSQQKRLSRTPGHAALSMTLTHSEKPQLILLNAADNTLVALDVGKPGGLAKPIQKSAPFGETPVYLESH